MPVDSTPQRSRYAWLHSPVLAGFLALVTAAAGVWGALTQVENNQQGEQNTDLRQTIESLQRQNTDLSTKNDALYSEVATLRSAAAAAPTATPLGGTTGQPLPDEANWKMPAALTGTWQGTLADRSADSRFNVTLTLNADGLGKGAEAGTLRYPTTTSDCLMKVYLAEIRVDGSVKLSGNANTCYYYFNDQPVVSLREGRIWYQNAFLTGALTKAS